MRCAVYARISSDPEDQQIGIDRQILRGGEIAERNGWTLVETFSDNDASGFKKIERSGFEAMKHAIERGALEAVVVQHQDRVARNVTAFREFADLCQRHDVRIETWSGPIDTSSAAGRFTSTIQAATDEHYSALISEKVRAANVDMAERGEPAGGRRPFGYIRTTNEAGVRTFAPHPDEAPLLVECFQQFVDGASIRSIAMGLDARGVPTAGGSTWSTGRVRDLLKNPIYAGLRVHRGQVVGEGNWSALVDDQTFEAVQALIAAPNRRTYTGGGVRTYYLAGGVARCALCDARLKSSPLRGHRSYVCPAVTDGGCGKIRIKADEFEGYVARFIVDVLNDPAVAAALNTSVDYSIEIDELEKIEDRRTGLAEAFAMGEIDRSQLAAATAKLNARRDELQARVAGAHSPIDVADLRGLWDSEDAEWRYRVADTLLEAVTVGPAVVGRNFFDEDRVEIVWRF